MRKAASSEGEYLLASMAATVWRVMPMRSASCAWVISPLANRSARMELVILVARSLVSSLADLQRATERVRAGDYGYRVPVVATDETGTTKINKFILNHSFLLPTLICSVGTVAIASVLARIII